MLQGRAFSSNHDEGINFFNFMHFSSPKNHHLLMSLYTGSLSFCGSTVKKCGLRKQIGRGTYHFVALKHSPNCTMYEIRRNIFSSWIDGTVK